MAALPQIPAHVPARKGDVRSTTPLAGGPAGYRPGSIPSSPSVKLGTNKRRSHTPEPREQKPWNKTKKWDTSHEHFIQLNKTIHSLTVESLPSHIPKAYHQSAAATPKRSSPERSVSPKAGRRPDKPGDGFFSTEGSSPGPTPKRADDKKSADDDTEQVAVELSEFLGNGQWSPPVLGGKERARNNWRKASWGILTERAALNPAFEMGYSEDGSAGIDKLHVAIGEALGRIPDVTLEKKWDHLAHHMKGYFFNKDSQEGLEQLSSLYTQSRSKFGRLGRNNEPFVAVCYVILDIMLAWLCKYQPTFKPLVDRVSDMVHRMTFKTVPAVKANIDSLATKESLDKTTLEYLGELNYHLCSRYESIIGNNETRAKQLEIMKDLIAEKNYWKNAYLGKVVAAWKMLTMNRKRVESEIAKIHDKSRLQEETIKKLEGDVVKEKGKLLQAEQDHQDAANKLKMDIRDLHDLMLREMSDKKKLETHVQYLMQQNAQLQSEIVSLKKQIEDTSEDSKQARETIAQYNDALPKVKELLTSVHHPMAEHIIPAVESNTQDVMVQIHKEEVVEYFNSLVSSYTDFKEHVQHMENFNVGCSMLNSLAVYIYAIKPVFELKLKVDEVHESKLDAHKVKHIMEMLEELPIMSFPVVASDLINDACTAARYALVSYLKTLATDPQAVGVVDPMHGFIYHAEREAKEVDMNAKLIDWDLKEIFTKLLDGYYASKDLQRYHVNAHNCSLNLALDAMRIGEARHIIDYRWEAFGSRLNVLETGGLVDLGPEPKDHDSCFQRIKTVVMQHFASMIGAFFGYALPSAKDPMTMVVDMSSLIRLATDCKLKSKKIESELKRVMTIVKNLEQDQGERAVAPTPSWSPNNDASDSNFSLKLTIPSGAATGIPSLNPMPTSRRRGSRSMSVMMSVSPRSGGTETTSPNRNRQSKSADDALLQKEDWIPLLIVMADRFGTEIEGDICAKLQHFMDTHFFRAKRCDIDSFYKFSHEPVVANVLKEFGTYLNDIWREYSEPMGKGGKKRLMRFEGFKRLTLEANLVDSTLGHDNVKDTFAKVKIRSPDSTAFLSIPDFYQALVVIAAFKVTVPWMPLHQKLMLFMEKSLLPILNFKFKWGLTK